jgi:hypothetical protein
MGSQIGCLLPAAFIARGRAVVDPRCSPHRPVAALPWGWLVVTPRSSASPVASPPYAVALARPSQLGRDRRSLWLIGLDQRILVTRRLDVRAPGTKYPASVARLGRPVRWRDSTIGAPLDELGDDAASPCCSHRRHTPHKPPLPCTGAVERRAGWLLPRRVAMPGRWSDRRGRCLRQPARWWARLRRDGWRAGRVGSAARHRGGRLRLPPCRERYATTGGSPRRLVTTKQQLSSWRRPSVGARRIQQCGSGLGWPHSAARCSAGSYYVLDQGGFIGSTAPSHRRTRSSNGLPRHSAATIGNATVYDLAPRRRGNAGRKTVAFGPLGPPPCHIACTVAHSARSGSRSEQWLSPHTGSADQAHRRIRLAGRLQPKGVGVVIEAATCDSAACSRPNPTRDLDHAPLPAAIGPERSSSR